MIIHHLRTMLLLCSIGSISAQVRLPIHIVVNQPRPLEGALDLLEKKIGIPINYEDPRLECASDIQDVAAQVQNAAQKAAHPNTRILIPAAGSLAFDSLFPAIPQAADALAAVTQLRQQYEANGYSGRFTVKAVGSVLTVEPSAARNANCALGPGPRP
jgi:hypothetical protein